MSTETPGVLQSDPTTEADASTEENPREECWCAGNDLPCFEHFDT